MLVPKVGNGNMLCPCTLHCWDTVTCLNCMSSRSDWKLDNSNIFRLACFRLFCMVKHAMRTPHICHSYGSQPLTR